MRISDWSSDVCSSDLANLDRFKENPEKYAPQYGGYCAYGVAQGNLVRIEPDKFTVLNGRVYLNYNAEVPRKLLRDPIGFIEDADAQLETLLKKRRTAAEGTDRIGGSMRAPSFDPGAEHFGGGERGREGK